MTSSRTRKGAGFTLSLTHVLEVRDDGGWDFDHRPSGRTWFANGVKHLTPVRVPWLHPMVAAVCGPRGRA
jgi:hypothetical protein